MRQTRLYIITVVHNRSEVTKQFCQALAAQTFQDFTLVLVDDGSTDGTAEMVDGFSFPRRVLKGDGNLWWAGGLQKGLNYLASLDLSSDTHVAFMNDDIGFDPQYLEMAVNEANQLPSKAFLVCPGVFLPSGNLSPEAGICDWTRFRFRGYDDRPDLIDHATTRSLFMRWIDVKKMGGFHTTLLPHYASDYEFTMRARRKKIRLVPARTVVAKFNELTTGTHRSGKVALRKRWEIMTSTRFSFNPFYMFMFIWYSCPLVYKIPCWTRIGLSSLIFLFKRSQA